MFDRSFDEEDLALAEAEAAVELAAQEDEFVELEQEIPTFTEDQLNAARNESFEAGREEGMQEAGNAIETKINDSLGRICTQLDELFKRQAVDTATTFTDAVNIAVAIARKCFPHLNDTHGFAEIERMVSEVLTEVIEEPRVIIHINPTLKDPLNERIETIARESNFEGQRLILEAEDLPPGDCRITWSSGTAERTMEGILSKIEQIVEANLGSIREEIVEEVAEKINGIEANILPTLAADTNDIATSGPAIAADIPIAKSNGSGETASAPTPTLVDEIDALAAEIAAGAAQQPTDSALLAQQPENSELVIAAADRASPPALPGDAVEESAEVTPTMSSAELVGRALESQKTRPFGAASDADQLSEEDIAGTLPPISNKEHTANTKSHLKAEPGNMEQDTNGVILNTLSASADVEDEIAFDADPDSGPPAGPNQ